MGKKHKRKKSDYIKNREVYMMVFLVMRRYMKSEIIRLN